MENNGLHEVVAKKKPQKVWLRVSLDVLINQHQFYYSLDGKRFTAAGEPFDMHEGNWKGFRIGLYCYGEQGKAQFDTFDYKILK
jgi:beta-xylosidase